MYNSQTLVAEQKDTLKKEHYKTVNGQKDHRLCDKGKKY